MATKVNTIEGTDRNDQLRNNNTSGLTYMVGYTGNDTFTVNNIAKNYTYIGNSWGNDTLRIMNSKGSDLLFLFDIGIYTDGNEIVYNNYSSVSPFYNGLIVVKKSMANSFVQQMKVLSLGGELPSSGAIEYDFSGATASQVQYKVKNIYAFDSTGSKYAFDLNKYAENIIPKINNFLTDCIGDPSQYDDLFELSISDILLYGNNSSLNTLINIYKNTPINYTITGTSSNDSLYGGSGADVVNAGAGNDTIKSGAGNDTVRGGKGNDNIYLQSGNDIAIFASGDGVDTINKGAGADTLRFDNFRNVAALKKGLKFSKSGNDLVLKYTNKDSVKLKNYYKKGVGTTVTTLKAKNGSSANFSDLYDTAIFNTYTGKKNKANKITGSSLNDLIKGNNKNDILKGGGGNDQIYGYAGNDTIYAGAGNDKVYAGAGNDKIYAQAGTNIIDAGTGHDTLYAGTGTDYLKGGAGNDTYIVSSLNSLTNITDTSGNDMLRVYSNSDTYLLFNVRKDGTFAPGDDKLYLANESAFDTWNTTGALPANGVVIKGFSSVETLSYTNSGRYFDTYMLNQIKSDVASWLSSANGGLGYDDVITALTSGEDVSALIAIFGSTAA